MSTGTSDTNEYHGLKHYFLVFLLSTKSTLDLAIGSYLTAESLGPVRTRWVV